MKDILIVVDNADKAKALLHKATAAAERMNAHIEVLVMTIPPMIATDLAPFGSLWVPPWDLERDNREDIERVRKLLPESDVEIEVRGLLSDVATAAADVRRQHPVADLILLSDERSWAVPWMYRHILESLLLSAGTPLFVLPNGHDLPPINHAVIGWKPSPQAMRAVHDLVQLAEPGARIDIAMVGIAPEHGDSHLAAAAGLERHLTRHGFTVHSQYLRCHADPEAQVLQNYTLEQGADLLAVGGYAHSRIREVFLGGVTRELTEEPRLPVMFSH
ncbi:universal stress protein [Stakelama marina]|uniref:Universal stress protein n=1 Tax=Stakelama marina TaxID=2826939 RepID=A0A8T4I9H0_9SPHN|nr:universal stress protein [Stakelama marina]MBR0551277.1 universal stress protein [Stakelama marina]